MTQEIFSTHLAQPVMQALAGQAPQAVQISPFSPEYGKQQSASEPAQISPFSPEYGKQPAPQPAHQPAPQPTNTPADAAYARPDPATLSYTPTSPASYRPDAELMRQALAAMQASAHAEKMAAMEAEERDLPGEALLEDQPANELLAQAGKLPPMRPLVGNLWQQGELAILFADTGVGKTAFSVQIADALAWGRGQVLGLASDFVPGLAGRQVLYLDFELTDRMFAIRYLGGLEARPHTFAPGFIRATVNMSSPYMASSLELAAGRGQAVQSFEQVLFEHMSAKIERRAIDVLVIDNITALTLKSTAEAEAALSLMRRIRQLQQERLEQGKPLSVLVLAHTPKIAPGQPLTLNHLGGSKHLSNFADSIFCLGRSSQGQEVRYLKQLKARNCAIRYHEQNVLSLSLHCDPYLIFDTVEHTCPEQDHLPQPEPREAKEGKGLPDHVRQQVADLLAQGNSYQQVAERLGISKSAAYRAAKQTSS